MPDRIGRLRLLVGRRFWPAYRVQTFMPSDQFPEWRSKLLLDKIQRDNTTFRQYRDDERKILRINHRFAVTV